MSTPIVYINTMYYAMVLCYDIPIFYSDGREYIGDIRLQDFISMRFTWTYEKKPSAVSIYAEYTFNGYRQELYADIDKKISDTCYTK